jgi:uncharacterized protein YciI
MRLLFVIGAAACLAAMAPASAAPAAEAPMYDAALAQRLGADERGMKKYVLVILKRGPKEAASEAERSKLFEGHMANINRLADEGKLVVAGPLGKNERGYSGIFVLNIADVAGADALMAGDPAVAAGAFTYEAFGWYGSAALMEVNAIHGRIDKTGR